MTAPPTPRKPARAPRPRAAGSRAPEPHAPRPPPDEQTVYGVKAGLALLEHRPADVRRIYHGPALRGALGPHLAAAAARHLPYRELDADALTKVAASPHHEGLVVIAAPRRYSELTPERARGGGASALWLALDDVENPHNLGALVRTAAFFGLTGVLAGGPAPGDKANAAVLRVSEGGAEHMPLFAAQRLTEGLRTLRGVGCRVLGLETDGSLSLADAVASGLAGGPLVLVLGAERAGLSAEVRHACEALSVLAGGGPLASLNVSVAAGVALALVLQRRAPPMPLREPSEALHPDPAKPPGTGRSAHRPAGPRQRPRANRRH